MRGCTRGSSATEWLGACGVLFLTAGVVTTALTGDTETAARNLFCGIPHAAKRAAVCSSSQDASSETSVPTLDQAQSEPTLGIEFALRFLNDPDRGSSVGPERIQVTQNSLVTSDAEPLAITEVGGIPELSSAATPDEREAYFRERCDAAPGFSAEDAACTMFNWDQLEAGAKEGFLAPLNLPDHWLAIKELIAERGFIGAMEAIGEGILDDCLPSRAGPATRARRCYGEMAGGAASGAVTGALISGFVGTPIVSPILGTIGAFLSKFGHAASRAKKNLPAVPPGKDLVPTEHGGPPSDRPLVATGGPAAGALTSQLGVNDDEPVCFGAGTPVLTPSGVRAIETIEVGEFVLARDPETGQTEARRVFQRFVTPDRPLRELNLTSGGAEVVRESLKVTAEHPFFVPEHGWRRAEDLIVGDLVSALDGELEVASNVPLDGRQTVYNLAVEEFHTYFVGETSAWVHNQYDVADGVTIVAWNPEPGEEIHRFSDIKWAPGTRQLALNQDGVDWAIELSREETWGLNKLHRRAGRSTQLRETTAVTLAAKLAKLTSIDGRESTMGIAETHGDFVLYESSDHLRDLDVFYGPNDATLRGPTGVSRAGARMTERLKRSIQNLGTDVFLEDGESPQAVLDSINDKLAQVGHARAVTVGSQPNSIRFDGERYDPEENPSVTPTEEHDTVGAIPEAPAGDDVTSLDHTRDDDRQTERPDDTSRSTDSNGLRATEPNTGREPLSGGMVRSVTATEAHYFRDGNSVIPSSSHPITVINREEAPGLQRSALLFYRWDYTRDRRWDLEATVVRSDDDPRFGQTTIELTVEGRGPPKAARQLAIAAFHEAGSSGDEIIVVRGESDPTSLSITAFDESAPPPTLAFFESALKELEIGVVDWDVVPSSTSGQPLHDLVLYTSRIGAPEELIGGMSRTRLLQETRYFRPGANVLPSTAYPVTASTQARTNGTDATQFRYARSNTNGYKRWNVTGLLTRTARDPRFGLPATEVLVQGEAPYRAYREVLVAMLHEADPKSGEILLIRGETDPSSLTIRTEDAEGLDLPLTGRLAESALAELNLSISGWELTESAGEGYPLHDLVLRISDANEISAGSEAPPREGAVALAPGRLGHEPRVAADLFWDPSTGALRERSGRGQTTQMAAEDWEVLNGLASLAGTPVPISRRQARRIKAALKATGSDSRVAWMGEGAVFYQTRRDVWFTDHGRRRKLSILFGGSPGHERSATAFVDSHSPVQMNPSIAGAIRAVFRTPGVPVDWILFTSATSERRLLEIRTGANDVLEALHFPRRVRGTGADAIFLEIADDPKLRASVDGWRRWDDLEGSELTFETAYRGIPVSLTRGEASLLFQVADSESGVVANPSRRRFVAGINRKLSEQGFTARIDIRETGLAGDELGGQGTLQWVPE